MHTGNGSVGKETGFRLDGFVKPSHYDIHLTPDLAKFVFDGEVAIEIELEQATNRIAINAKELEIESFVAIQAGGQEHKAKVTVCEETEIATLQFAETLAAGKWTLKSSFKGTLNDKLKGFYRSFWVDEKGEKQPIATTQFESTDARRAFPCFDEPAFKATFDVRLTVDEKLTALSNGAVVKTEPAPGGKKTITYERTMKMSTYLVCFCVGNFVSSKPIDVNGIEVRIWSVPGKEKLTSFALDVSAFAIDYYEKYFEIPYPGGKKIDHIAIPDFASGAMENLGLITYRETALLLDEAHATHAERKRVAEVVMHELAHMWFGDLVTMGWWNGLWLNESFATFMENLCLSKWKPEWEIWNDFGLSRAAASRVDALNSTHPIECPVNHPDEAAEMFDVISYEKGCSVLYQIHEFIGAETFRKGIAAYLKKHSYGNTETHDLWDALEEACQNKARHEGLKEAEPVRLIMDRWVFTPGHPVVEASAAGTGETVSKLALKQSPFKFLKQSQTAQADSANKEETTWPIPLSLRALLKDGKLIEKRILMEEKSKDVELGGEAVWVVLNAGGSGFYRVTYDRQLTSLLTKNGGPGDKLSSIERFNLVNDAWACVRAGILPASDYLNLIQVFESENDPNVWAIVLASLGHLNSLTAVGSEARASMARLIRKLARPAFDKLGLHAAQGSAETVQTKQLRSTLLSTLGTIGEDKDLSQKGMQLFESWCKDRATLDADLVPAVVSITAYHGEGKAYDNFLALSKAATSPQEVQRFLFALARFRDKALLKRTIDACLSDDVRTQDAPYLFAALMSNEEAGSDAWRFLKENWQTMVDRYPENGVVRMVSAVSSLDKPELANDVRSFFAAHPVKSGEMAVAQALEQLDINVKLREREEKNLSESVLTGLVGARS